MAQPDPIKVEELVRNQRTTVVAGDATDISRWKVRLYMTDEAGRETSYETRLPEIATNVIRMVATGGATLAVKSLVDDEEASLASRELEVARLLSGGTGTVDIPGLATCVVKDTGNGRACVVMPEYFPVTDENLTRVGAALNQSRINVVCAIVERIRDVLCKIYATTGMLYTDLKRDNMVLSLPDQSDTLATWATRRVCVIDLGSMSPSREYDYVSTYPAPPYGTCPKLPRGDDRADCDLKFMSFQLGIVMAQLLDVDTYLLGYNQFTVEVMEMRGAVTKAAKEVRKKEDARDDVEETSSDYQDAEAELRDAEAKLERVEKARDLHSAEFWPRWRLDALHACRLQLWTKTHGLAYPLARMLSPDPANRPLPADIRFT